MSRIGKKPIIIPEKVAIVFHDNELQITGPRGELRRVIHPDMGIELTEQELRVVPRRQSKKSSALWGLTRSLVANMVEGVVNGYEKKLEFEGVGYRVNIDGDSLVMQLGFSHPVRFKGSPDTSFKVEKNVITIGGINKESVGETAARLRSLKPPEPYKGKGIRYQGEVIRRKAGKKAVASA